MNLLFKTLETQVFDSTADVQAHLSPPPVTKTTVDVDLRDPLPISNSHDESEKKTTKEPVNFNDFLVFRLEKKKNQNCYSAFIIAFSIH